MPGIPAQVSESPSHKGLVSASVHASFFVPHTNIAPVHGYLEEQIPLVRCLVCGGTAPTML